MIEEVTKSMRKRGTANQRLCRFLTWFWFCRDNRTSSYPSKIVYVLTPWTFRVEQMGSMKTIWLKGEGCYGYEYPRQAFIALGEFLRRWRWFSRWDRCRCPKCRNDEFMCRYRDLIDSYYGPVCEEVMCCKKCKEDVSQFCYGSYESWYTSRWMELEKTLFGVIQTGH